MLRGSDIEEADRGGAGERVVGSRGYDFHERGILVAILYCIEDFGPWAFWRIHYVVLEGIARVYNLHGICIAFDLGGIW